MFTIKKILVPIDSFTNSNPLVDYATFYAEKFGATLTFVHVLENPMAYEGFAVAEFEADLAKHVEADMGKFIREHSELCETCTGFVLNGSAPLEIVDFAKKENFDLIIIGSHRYNAIERFILGSVAEKVAHRASCPVVIYNFIG